jgi:uncharacterized damage-inducible protein DinB
LDYCESLPEEVFAGSRSDFGHGSIHGTLIHVAGCYRYWLAATALQLDMPEFRQSDYPTAAGIRRLFAGSVDPLVDAFLAEYGANGLGVDLEWKVGWRAEPLRFSPLWVLTHMITHEFHHKGQIVAFGRILGYPPPETDLVLPRAAK